MPIGECEIKIEADMPEQVTIQFVATGFMGGDAGHGGNATLDISWEGGTYGVEADGREVLVPNVSGAALCAWGDWEQHGLVKALVELGKKLQPVLDEMEKAANR